MPNEEKYKQFENNNLPTPYWNEERNVQEYVYYEDNELKVCDTISRAIEEIAFYGFYYPFNIRHKEIYFGDKDNERTEIVTGHIHEHTFEDVVRALYHHPEYFSIPEEDEVYYSKQELKYLRSVQKYLLFLGLKDDLDNSKDNKRYQNERYAKYKWKPIYTLSDEAIDDVINGKRDYLLREYSPRWSEQETYESKEKIALIRNDDGDFRVSVEIIKNEIKDGNEYETEMNKREFKIKDKVVVKTIKLLEIFK